MSMASLVVSLVAETSRFRGEMERATNQSRRNFKQIEGYAKTASMAVKGLAGALGAGISTRAFITAADAATQLQNRLRLVSESSQQAADSYQKIYDIAQRSRVSFADLGTTYAAVARNTAELGISQDRLMVTTEAIANAMVISGGSAESMNAALVQLGQAFASGTLRGQELNSVMEQTPRLAMAIANGMGVGIGQLRKMAEAGEVTSEAIIKALENQSAILKGEVAQSTITVAQAMTQLGNAAVKAAGEFNEALQATAKFTNFVNESMIPAIGRMSTEFSVAMQNANGFWDALKIFGTTNPFRDNAENLAHYREELVKLQKARDVLMARRGGLLDMFSDTTAIDEDIRVAEARIRYFRTLMGDMGQSDTGAQGGAAAIPTAPPVRVVADKKAIEAAKKEAEAYAKWMEGFEEAGRQRQIEVIERRMEQERKAAQETMDWIEQHEQASQDRLYEIQKKRLDDQEALIEKTRQSYRELGESIGSSIGNNLENAIMQGMKFKDVVRAIIQDMIRLAIQKTIVNSLTSGFGDFFGSVFGGGRALGGPVRAGTSYLVGEKGPEVFTPTMSGNITPNGAGAGANVTVNVNMSGGGDKVEGEGQGRALGAVIAAAVKSELINQRRPGGLLA